MFLHVRPFSLFFFSIFPFLCVFSCVFGHPPFLISFLNICYSCVSFFVVLFECIFFFWRFSLIWLSYFCLFVSFYILTFLFQKPRFFTKLFLCLLSPFLKQKKSFLLVPVFSLHQKKLCHWKFVLTHFETSVFELFTFTSTNSTFYLLECLFCLFIPSFCSSSIHFFSLLSLRVFSFLSLFHFFYFSFFLGLGSSLLLSFSVFFFSQKNTNLFVSFTVGHVLHLFFLLCLVFLCREKWFLVFVLTFLFVFFFFLLFNIQFLIYYFPVLMHLQNCCFFFNELEKNIFCFFSFCLFSFLLFLFSRFF